MIVENIKEINKRLTRLSQRLSSNEMQRIMATIGGMVRGQISEAFEQEREIGGKKWEKISKKREWAKFKRGRLHILRDSGNLADNWSVRVSAWSVVVSNNSKNRGFSYGIVHQMGGKSQKRRAFLPLSKDGKLESRLKRRIMRYLGDHLSKV